MEGREALLDMMRAADIISIAGEESVMLALDAGLLGKDQVKRIAGIPYAQVVLV